MFRLICILIGYIFGNILTAEIVARKYARKSAFDIGSGNPGMANIMAQCGFKPGIFVLIGDLLKTVLPCLLCGFLLYPEYRAFATAWAGLGAVIGHNYPVWHKFRGGKGVSSTCAVLFCIHPLWGILAMIVGMLGVFITQYLPYGGVLIPLAFVPIAYFKFSMEMTLIAAALTVIMLIRHIPGFAGIKTGKEKKINVPALIRKKLFSNKENKDEQGKSPENMDKEAEQDKSPENIDKRTEQDKSAGNTDKET